MLPYKKLLLKVSGSIAAYKSCDLVSLLKTENPGLQIKVVLSKNAHRFVGPEALEALSGNKVHQDIFEPGQLMEHIHLARWADATLVYPASANTISALAHGRCDTLIGALFLAYDLGSKPYFVAPAMNTKMWDHPATQKSMIQLKDYGVQILPTESGPLACGEVGLGRLLSPAKTRDFLLGAQGHRKKILITSGATREPIDGVRFITNFSSGKTGATLAQSFADSGHRVTLLHGKGAAEPRHPGIESIAFSDFKDFKVKLFGLLEETPFDVILQAAAISDYSVDCVEVNSQKLSADSLIRKKLPTSETLQLTLKKNSKLISRLREKSLSPTCKIIGFKLTKTTSTKDQLEAVTKLSAENSVDFVVHNDLLDIEAGTHRFRIFDKNLRLVASPIGASMLAEDLQRIVITDPDPKTPRDPGHKEIEL